MSTAVCAGSPHFQKPSNTTKAITLISPHSKRVRSPRHFRKRPREFSSTGIKEFQKATRTAATTTLLHGSALPGILRDKAKRAFAARTESSLISPKHLQPLHSALLRPGQMASH